MSYRPYLTPLPPSPLPPSTGPPPQIRIRMANSWFDVTVDTQNAWVTLWGTIGGVCSTGRGPSHTHHAAVQYGPRPITHPPCCCADVRPPESLYISHQFINTKPTPPLKPSRLKAYASQ